MPTLTRGIMGFGKNSRIHRAHLLGLSDDLPERIEVVDRPERIDEHAAGTRRDGRRRLIVVEDVRVVRYRHDPEVPGGTVPGQGPEMDCP